MDQLNNYTGPTGGVPSVMPFAGVASAPPVIPKLYWDAYSDEQRLKLLWQGFGQLADLMNQLGYYYVPNFAGEWSATVQYPPLTVVSAPAGIEGVHEGDSYTALKYVPVGTPLTNTEYWALTGNYNAQITDFKNAVSSQIQAISDSLDTTKSELLVSAKTIGCDSTGQTDCTSAVQQALDSGASYVIFEPGQYKFDSTLVMPSRSSLIGLNKRGTQLRYTGSGVFISVSSTESTDTVEISNLSIFGPDPDTTATLVSFDKGYRLIMQDVMMFYFSTAVRMSGTNGTTGSSKFMNMNFDNPGRSSSFNCFELFAGVNAIEISSCGGNLYNLGAVLASSECTDVWIRDCNWKNTKNAITVTNASTPGTDVKIQNNIFDNAIGYVLSHSYSAAASGEWGCEFTNNWISTNSSDTGSAYVVTLNGCNGYKIAENHFSNAISSSVSQRCIIMSDCERCVIANNTTYLTSVFLNVIGGGCINVSGNNVLMTNSKVFINTTSGNLPTYMSIIGNTVNGNSYFITSPSTNFIAIGNVSSAALIGCTTEGNVTIS